MPDCCHIGTCSLHDIVKIDKVLFEIIWGGGLLKSPPPSRVIRCLKYPRLDRIGVTKIIDEYHYQEWEVN